MRWLSVLVAWGNRELHTIVAHRRREIRHVGRAEGTYRSVREIDSSVGEMARSQNYMYISRRAITSIVQRKEKWWLRANRKANSTETGAEVYRFAVNFREQIVFFANRLSLEFRDFSESYGAPNSPALAFFVFVSSLLLFMDYFARAAFTSSQQVLMRLGRRGYVNFPIPLSRAFRLIISKQSKQMSFVENREMKVVSRENWMSALSVTLNFYHHCRVFLHVSVTITKGCIEPSQTLFYE